MPGHKTIFISSWLIALVLSAISALAAEQQDNAGNETPPGVSSDDGNADALEPEIILVTATKAEKDAQAVSISLSAFPEQQLRDARVFGMNDVALITPNFHFYSVGSRRAALFFIRGVGSSGPNQPAVGVFVDDVYQQTGFSDFDLSDVERIEVLRGPQSTLYGRNTASGAINVITKKPTSRWEARIGYGPSSFDSHRAELYAGGPLIADKLSLSIAGCFFNRGGYSENDFLQTDADHVKQYAGRITLRYNPTDKLAFGFSTRGGWDRDGGYPLVSLNEHRLHPYHVNYNTQARHQRDLLSYTLKTTYSTDSYTLQSISNYTDWSNAEDYDRDFMPLDLFNVEERNRLDSVSQEFRLSSKNDSQPFQWLAGVYGFAGLGNDYQRNHYGQDAGMFGAPPGMVEHSPLDKNTYGAAIFGQATYSAFEHLEVTAGLRYDYEKQTMAGQVYRVLGNDVYGETVEVDKQKTLNAITPEMSFAWNWTRDLKTYARLARGFRSGGFNSPEGSNPAAYDPEFVWNYELGLKSCYWDKKLTVNLTLFQMDIHNQQLI
ncbi:MAG: TonB-dependent receptor [Deltaproteobacteria bacterium]|nr:TonB-dependent receptor [Deltaproteobacteria bacterium]